jgi:prevent-host-death family protein
MQTVVNVHEFKTHYSKYLEIVERGGTVLVGRRGKPVAQVSPVLPQPTTKKRQFGQLKGKIWMSDDFDEPMTELWDQIANRGMDQLVKK